MKLQTTYISLFVSALVLMISFTGCDKEEPLPIYLELKSAKVALNAAGTATTEVGIKDFWIEHNAASLGVYRVPRSVPLLPERTGNNLAVFGGIFENGLSSFRSPYPFWKPVFVELPDVAPLDTFPLELTFEYFEDSLLQFPLSETFENASFSFEEQSTSPNSTFMFITSTDKFQGDRSGKVEFNADQFDFEIISTSFTSDFFALPQSGNNDIYIEIAYKNDISFTAGMYYVSPTGQVGEIPSNVTFNSGMEWNMVYLHMNQEVRSLPQNSLFRLYIRANSAGESGTIFLDNIRIVHFR